MGKVNRATVDAWARGGALAQAREAVAAFPDILDQLIAEKPGRSLSAEQRAELAAAVNGGSSKRKWTAARRRKFMATVKRKRQAGQR